MARHVRKGDQVVVTQGSDKGKTGEVLKVIQGGPGARPWHRAAHQAHEAHPA